MRTRAALAILLGFAACGPAPGGGARAPAPESAQPRRPVALGDTLAPFRAERLDAPGTSLTIPSGNVTLVAFLATWSEPDKRSIPKLEAIYAKHAARGLVVVDVAIDDEPDHVLEFAQTYGARFPVVWDKGHELSSKLAIATDPTFLVVDSKGVVRFIHNGYHEGEDETMEREVAALLPR